MSDSTNVNFRENIIDRDLFNELMKSLGLKGSDIMRNYRSSLVNRKDELEKIKESGKIEFNDILNQLPEIDYQSIVDSQKEMTIDLPDFEGLEIVFRRRSDSNQSLNTEQEEIVSMRDNGEIDSIILSFEDNSSYKDMAFLKALQYAKMKNLPLRIYSKTRSELETVTRSAENMKIYVTYAQEQLMFDVSINGFNLFYDGSLLIFLAEINESKWLSNANTKLAEKHFKYKFSLKNKNLDNLEPLERKEVISLLKYNRSIDKVIKFFEYLENKYINNKKRILKRLNEGKLNKAEKKNKFTLKELIEKHSIALKEMTERIMKSRE